MEQNLSIPTAVDECARNFISLVGRLEAPSQFSEQVSAELIADECDRLKLWAGNIAAHKKGRRSLQNRLRDAPELQADTLDQLTFLSDSQNQALAIIDGQRVPWDEMSSSDSEDDDSDTDDETELKQVYGSIRTAITSLMRISLAIREPAQAIQPRSIDKSAYEKSDEQHVWNEFPAAPSFLCERLGLAITSRRRYFTYREEHHEKPFSGIAKLGYEAPETESTIRCTGAINLRRIDLHALWNGRANAKSTKSFATSTNATLRVPNLPKESYDKEYHGRPFCHDLVGIHTVAEWKRHVYQDLHPYCCTFESCATADRLFVSRNAWFAHELEVHYSTFQCVEGCSRIFRTETEFQDHVKSDHDDLTAPNIYSVLKKTSAKTPALTAIATCCLCDKQMMLRALQKHIGHHQEHLAFFALPVNTDDSEVDQTDKDFGALPQNEVYDEDAEEASDTSETSDIKQLTKVIVRPEKHKMLGEQQIDSNPHNSLQIAPRLSFAKIRTDFLDVKTLHHYVIPYEYDDDPNYIILLREMSQKEMDMMFDHTRRLRSNHGDRLFMEKEKVIAMGGLHRARSPVVPEKESNPARNSTPEGSPNS